jgi:hypothetical protein
MKDIDQQIREALRQEDAELLEHYRGEPPLHEMLIETFRGRWRWLVALTFVMVIVAMALMAVCAYQFFHAEAIRAMIAWTAGFLWCLTFIAMIKVWYWMELNRNSVTREIKRLELQVAQLSRLGAEEAGARR